MATIYFICGVPCSGKTTLAVNMPLSMMLDDTLNILHLEDNKDNDELKNEVETMLKSEHDIVIDSHIFVEQWVLDEWIKYINSLKHKSKVIIMSTPLDIIIERNNKKENPIEKSKMQHLYNNFIMTIGWLYLEHPDKIINSMHV